MFVESWKHLGLALCSVPVVWILLQRRRMSQQSEGVASKLQNWSYDGLRHSISENGIGLPSVFVSLPNFDRNTDACAQAARQQGKTIRIATKSIRVPWLIARAMERHPDVFKGFMCYNISEALFLRSHFHNTPVLLDFLIAYPTVQPKEIEAVLLASAESGQRAATFRLMVDCVEHVRKISGVVESWNLRNGSKIYIQVCVDIDVSFKALNGRVHLGVHRSSCRDVTSLRNVCEEIRNSAYLQLSGFMGYEAQIAGVGELNPFISTLLQWGLSLFKWATYSDVRTQRLDALEELLSSGIAGNGELFGGSWIFNGGGSGSLTQALQDDSLTEVTIGSRLLQSKLFDYYRNISGVPALVFALEYSRCPEPSDPTSCRRAMICCHGGGFIASGAVGHDKQPSPFLPLSDGDMKPVVDEGFGEVQTPLQIVSEESRIRLFDELKVDLGDPIFFRPAKAGEIAERFQVYHCVDESCQVVATVPTYRGYGKSFH